MLEYDLEVVTEFAENLADDLDSEMGVNKGMDIMLETLHDPYLGKTIDGAVIQRKLGQGGMGSVYLARHLTLDKYVALKILPYEFSNDSKAIERFFREARFAAKLEHPNIVQVFNVGRQEHIYFLMMQFVEGQSLQTHLEQRGKLSLPHALWVMKSAFEGLAVAHQQGIVHRDIKPDNVMISSEGHLKIVDFGLARFNESRISIASKDRLVGTPYFMSPEQCKEESIDQRSDIYSLGITCYYMLSGELPYRGEKWVSVLLQHLDPQEATPLAQLKNSDIPLPLSQIVQKMMAKARSARYAQLTEVLQDLETVFTHYPPQAFYSERSGFIEKGIQTEVLSSSESLSPEPLRPLKDNAQEYLKSSHYTTPDINPRDFPEFQEIPTDPLFVKKSTPSPSAGSPKKISRLLLAFVSLFFFFLSSTLLFKSYKRNKPEKPPSKNSTTTALLLKPLPFLNAIPFKNREGVHSQKAYSYEETLQFFAQPLEQKEFQEALQRSPTYQKALISLKTFQLLKGNIEKNLILLQEKQNASLLRPDLFTSNPETMESEAACLLIQAKESEDQQDYENAFSKVKKIFLESRYHSSPAFSKAKLPFRIFSDRPVEIYINGEFFPQYNLRGRVLVQKENLVRLPYAPEYFIEVRSGSGGLCQKFSLQDLPSQFTFLFSSSEKNF